MKKMKLDRTPSPQRTYLLRRKPILRPTVYQRLWMSWILATISVVIERERVNAIVAADKFVLLHSRRVGEIVPSPV